MSKLKTTIIILDQIKTIIFYLILAIILTSSVQAMTYITMSPHRANIISEPLIDHNQSIYLVDQLPQELLRNINYIRFHDHRGHYNLSSMSDSFPFFNPLAYPSYRGKYYCGFFIHHKTYTGNCFKKGIEIYPCHNWDPLSILWHELGHYYDLCKLGNSYEDRIEEAENFADNFRDYWRENYEFT